MRLTTIPLKKVPIRPQGRNSKSSVQGSQRTASRATMIHEEEYEADKQRKDEAKQASGQRGQGDKRETGKEP